MKFRGIDGDGDWEFGSGRGSYFTAEAAINANIRTRLLVWLGECFFALQDGVDWKNLLGGKRPEAQQGIILQCRTIIVASFGVVKLNTLNAVFDPRSRKLNVTYTISTIFSRNVAQSVQLSA